jgi:drug/metabolite transporter (DMT)-like permease
MPYIFIIAATTIWGFGFIATKWALVAMSPVWLTTIRYAVAFLVMVPFLLFLRQKDHHRELAADSKHLWTYALICSALLSGLMIFQTVGLVHTTATNSAFLTTLYAIFVPMITFALFRTQMSFHYILAVGAAAFGSALLCGMDVSMLVDGQWNEGDLYSMLGALFAALHIVGLERLTRKPVNIHMFNALQYMFTAIFVLPFAIIFEPQVIHTNIDSMSMALGGFLFLAIPSTVGAFSLQTFAQKSLPSSTASLLLLLESPFAMFFAYLLLNESVDFSKLTGAVLIICSSLLVVVPTLVRKPS